MTSLLTPGNIAWLKFGIALVACALLYLEAKRGRRVAERWKKAIGIALSVAAIGCYVDFFQHRTERYYHRWEMYHYYLGSKYARELGYERLYLCAAIADAETGNRDAVLRRTMRDLRTNRLIRAAEVLDDPQACKQHFTAARWESFEADVRWFRASAGSGAWWDSMQKDHGYNPSPVWTAAGHVLTSIGPPSHGLCTALSSLDVVLMVSAIAVLAWAFGWRLAVIALIFWGTQAPAAYQWTGGGLLRQDWLFLLLLSPALLRKGYPLGAGAALAYAALLRVFPVLFFLGPLVLIATQVARRSRLARAQRRFLLGAVLAASVLIPAGALVAGPQAYGEFARKIQLHASTPISNHVSLRTLFSASSDARLETKLDPSLIDSVAPWREARRRQLDENRWLFWLTGAALLAWFITTTRRLRTPWLALALGVVPVFALTDPSCYYHTFWVVAAVLSRARRSLEMALLGVAGLGQMVVLRVAWFDDRYLALAVLYLLFAVILLFIFSRPPALRAVRFLRNNR